MKAAVLALVLILAVLSCGTSPKAQGSAASTPSATEYPNLSQTPSAIVSPTAVPTPTPSAAPPSCLGGVSSPAPGSTPQVSPPASPAPSVHLGAIAGGVSTPAEVIVPQLVYAISTAGASHGAYSTETVWNQSNYTIEAIAPGTYYVYSTRRPLECGEDGAFDGALYSEAVKCGLDISCTSHKPIPVTVRSDATTAGVDPVDWYATNVKLPPPPSWVVPYHPPVPASRPTYGSARAAAVAASQQQESALVVDSMTNCPVNRACSSIGTEHDGTEAAYFVGVEGSNGNFIACGDYVIHDRSGWRQLRRDCPGYGAAFPAVGQSGAVALGFQNGAPGGCANVRSLPGPKGKVVACLPDGTRVRLDGGPVYAPLVSSDGLWWHIAGRGWMADDFFGHPVGP